MISTYELSYVLTDEQQYSYEKVNLRVLCLSTFFVEL